MEARSFIEALRVAGCECSPATKHDARALARMMRAEDRAEAWASDRATPEAAVRASVNRSNEAWALRAGGDLLAVFGIMRLPNGKSAPWALTSVYVPKHARAFWRASKIVISHFRDSHPEMTQMAHAKYVPALRWLERLGFKIEPMEKFGKGGEMFCPATLSTKQIVLGVG